MPSYSETLALVRSFLQDCKQAGWSVSTGGSIVTIQTTFEPGDNDAYVKADGESFQLMSILPHASTGSTWGTTGDGVGGHVGKEHGYYTLKCSAISKRALKLLALEIEKGTSPDNLIGDTP